MSNCSVVIRSLNEERHIGRLLAGILQQSVAVEDIVLVDSGSSDATLSIASRYPVKILSISPSEFTFGRSLNLGCSHARGDFLVIASAHVYPVYTDWLEHLLKPFENPQVALTYGKQRGSEESIFSEAQHFKKLYPDVSNGPQAHPFCNNANAAVRRARWLEHPYNEELTGLEDLEWASWAMHQRYQVCYSAEAEVVHVHRESPRQIYNRYRREAIALKRIRPVEHFGLWDFLRFYLSSVSSDLWHALRKGMLGESLPSIFGFRWMQFWGTYRGFSYSGSLSPALREVFYYPLGLDAAGPASQRPAKAVDYTRLADEDRQN
jgi:rhamnosyltransferase